MGQGLDIAPEGVKQSVHMSSVGKPTGSKRVAGLIEAGLWLQVAGDLKGAQAIFQQALELDPGNVRAKQLCASLATKGSTEAKFASPPQTVTPVPTPSRPNDQTILHQPTRAQMTVEDILREARRLQTRGELDRACGLVLRALVLDKHSLEAHEFAYELMCQQGRDDVAAVELVHVVKECMSRGEVIRARRYLPALSRLRALDPKTDGLAAKLLGDADDTWPPSKAKAGHGDSKRAR